MSNLKLTINPFPETCVETSSWNIREKDEPERISVRRGEREYSIVFDEEVRFEVWSIDEQGELNERLEVLESQTGFLEWLKNGGN